MQLDSTVGTDLYQAFAKGALSYNPCSMIILQCSSKNLASQAWSRLLQEAEKSSVFRILPAGGQQYTLVALAFSHLLGIHRYPLIKMWPSQLLLPTASSTAVVGGTLLPSVLQQGGRACTTVIPLITNPHLRLFFKLES